MLPLDRAKQAEYARKQTDALTHDITSIWKYKNSYVGDASNVGNLFWNLPLNNVEMKFEINSETCGLTVNYLDTVWGIGKEAVQRNLVYNSVAAMAVIDNLSRINYHFSGEDFSFSREQIEEVFGSPLSRLLKQKVWEKEVQEKLYSTELIKKFFK